MEEFKAIIPNRKQCLAQEPRRPTGTLSFMFASADDLLCYLEQIWGTFLSVDLNTHNFIILFSTLEIIFYIPLEKP